VCVSGAGEWRGVRERERERRGEAARGA